MKLKILTKFPIGTTYIEEIEIESFIWEENHKFKYIPIWNGHSIHRYIELRQNEDIVGLSMWKELKALEINNG